MLSKNTELTVCTHSIVKSAKILLNNSGVLDLWHPGQHCSPKETQESCTLIQKEGKGKTNKKKKAGFFQRNPREMVTPVINNCKVTKIQFSRFNHKAVLFTV